MTYGPNGEVYDDAGNLISSSGSPVPASKGFGQLPPEAPGGNLQADTSQGAPSFKPTPESDTSATGSYKKQQTQQPTDISKAISDLMARRRGQGGGATGGGAGAVYDAQGNVVSSSPGLTAQQAAGAGSTMDASGAIRDPSGDIYDSSANLAAQDVGGAGATMPGGGAASGATTGGGGAGAMGAIGGAIGSIGSALQSALSNVPSWKMQASAIPDPSTFKQNQPQYNFQRKQIV